MSRGKGKGKGKGKSKGKIVHVNVDDQEALSQAVKEFHENISEVPLPDHKHAMWMNEVFYEFPIATDQETRNYFMNHCFMHLADLGKEKNKRIYIGPGRDGSSHDKISVDCKFMSSTTKIVYSTYWINWGFKKSAFVLLEEGDTNWKMIEDQVELWFETQLDDRVYRMVVIIHPEYHSGRTSLLAIIDEDCRNDEEVFIFAGTKSHTVRQATTVISTYDSDHGSEFSVGHGLSAKELRANALVPNFPEGIYKYDCCSLCARIFGPRDRMIWCTWHGAPHCSRCGQCPLPEGWNI